MTATASARGSGVPLPRTIGAVGCHAPSAPLLSVVDFQTVLVGFPSGPTPPIRNRPSPAATTEAPARASGRSIDSFASAAVFHPVRAPVVASGVRIYAVFVGAPEAS